MLELRPSCENCDKDLPNDSEEARICTYECTFCADCVENILNNVCPNCGGGFEKRPTRPKNELLKNPMRLDKIYKPINVEAFNKLKELNQKISPRNR